MKHPLRLIPTQRAQREAAAWLIPGEDAAAWLDALPATGAPLRDLRLHLLPRSAGDLGPRGVLVTSAGPAAPQRPDARCEPYGLEAGRLYLPTHARLSPAIDHAECRNLIRTGPSLLHPVAGLIAFEPGDVLRPLDLFSAPPPRQSAWDRARPGVTLNPRLLSVMPLAVPTLRQIEDDLRGDIGTRPLGDAPPQDDEPKESMINRAARGAGRGFYSAIAGIAKWAAGGVAGKPKGDIDLSRDAKPGGAGGTGAGFFETISGGIAKFLGFNLNAGASRVLSDIADWAKRKVQQWPAASEQARQRELDRLLRMLARNPLEALKYAIPLNASDLGRGIAPPGNVLPPRDVDFSLSGLGGGGPVDAWEIPWEKQQELSRRYREMAMQEARAGRHRRAAYIFANLLGDLNAAAGVLEEGGYFREAAVIWRDRLKAPGLAARCLERGGLLGEAVAIYEELRQWMDAARLYRRLEREEDARRCVLLEVEDLEAKRDYLTAAKLLETDIKDVDAAVNMLEQGCLHAAYRQVCFEELLLLLGRHGRHRAAGEAVDTMTGHIETPGDACALGEVLSRVRSKYPDRAAGDHMMNAVYAIASSYLPHSTPEHAERLTRSLAALAPQDRLLSRDGQRYVKQRRAAASRDVVGKPSKADHVVVQIGEGELPGAGKPGFRVYGGASVGRFFFAGVRNATDVPGAESVIRGDAGGRFATVSWSSRGVVRGNEDHQAGITVHVGHHESDHVIIQRPGGRLPDEVFPEAERCPMMRVVMPQWLPSKAAALCTAMYGQVWTITAQPVPLEDGGDLVINGYSREGKLIESRSLDARDLFEDLTSDDAPGYRFHLHVRPQRILLSYGNRLHYPGAKKRPYTTFGQEIRGIFGAAPFARSRFAVLHPTGASIVWTTETDDSSSGVAADLVEPVGAFTRQSGLLVLAGAGECRVFGTSKGRIEPVQTIRWREPARRRPIAVLPLDPNDDFSVLFDSGQIVHYHVTPPAGARR